MLSLKQYETEKSKISHLICWENVTIFVLIIKETFDQFLN